MYSFLIFYYFKLVVYVRYLPQNIKKNSYKWMIQIHPKSTVCRWFNHFITQRRNCDADRTGRIFKFSNSISSTTLISIDEYGFIRYFMKLLIFNWMRRCFN